MKKQLIKLSKHRFIPYTIIGTGATLLDWSTFFISTFILNFHYILGTILALIVGGSFKFFLNKFITFKNRSKKYTSQIIKFIIVSIISGLANLVIMFIFIDILFLHKLLSRVMTTFIILFLNYTLDNSVTYR